MLRRSVDVRQQWLHLYCHARCSWRHGSPAASFTRLLANRIIAHCHVHNPPPHCPSSFSARHSHAHAKPVPATSTAEDGSDIPPVSASSRPDTSAATTPVNTHSFASTLQLPNSTFPLHFNSALHEPRLSPLTTTALYRHQQTHPLLQPDLTPSSSPPLFLLHDGPPFANGKLHIGHFLNKTLKDIHNRHQLLLGNRVHYVSGWDCHGLPIELKALAHSADADSQSSPLHIRRTARAFASAAIEEQKADFMRWGVLTDWNVTYRTMDAEYEAQQLTVLLQLHRRGLLYRAKKPVWWSPATRTALAEAELEYEEEHVSRAVWVMFPVVEGEVRQQLGDVSVLVWTTTPWTLPGNVAIAYSPDVDYVVAKIGQRSDGTGETTTTENAEADDGWREGKQLLIARERVDFVSSLLRRHLTVVSSVSTASLAASITSHPFLSRTSPLLPATHVTTETGTAFVHTAPAHGVDDFIACKAAGIDDMHDYVDERGQFTAGVGCGLEGKEVLGEGSERVIELLRERGQLLHVERYVHRYPYDWRSKTPVITRTTEQWFARLDALQSDALNAIAGVQFTPEAGRGRLAAMVSGRKEWCLSRQRVWGVPIPVFYREDGQVLMSEENVTHVIELVRQHGTDCWWEMDEQQLLHPRYRNDGHTYTRGQDTMDVWFDSGTSWLPALNHLTSTHSAPPTLSTTPASTTTPSTRQFDVYLEGSDQHRGWFQSSLLTSVAMRGVAPYKRIVTHGFVLDEVGRKMSKSIGNVIDPNTIISGLPLPTSPSTAFAATAAAVAVPSKTKQKKQAQTKSKQYTSTAPTGVDFLRLWVSSIDYTHDASIGPTSLAKVGDTYKKVRALCRWMLGCVDGMAEGGRVGWDELLGVDRWMVRKCEELVGAMAEEYSSGRYNRVYALLTQLLNVELSAYYSDISKDRLYASGATSVERRSVQTVLCVVLECVMKVIAPIMPHTAEDINQHMDKQVKRWMTNSMGDTSHPPAQLDSAFLYGWCSILSEAGGLRRVRRGREAEYEAEYERYELVRRVRGEVNRVLEVARHEKKRESIAAVDGTRVVGEGTLAPVEADVTLWVQRGGRVNEALRRLAAGELRTILGVAEVQVENGAVEQAADAFVAPFEVTGKAAVETTNGESENMAIRVRRAQGVVKCNRCWRYCRSERNDCLCTRCVQVLHEAGHSL